jgi:microcystin-dependent protein
MATNLSVTHLWGKLPENYEPSGPDDFVQQLSKILTSYMAGTYTTINFGSSTPAAEDQDKPWFRTTATGEFDRVYSYSSTYGKWVSPHPAPYSGSERRIWVGSEAALLSYDGGDGSSAAPAATTGAMWQIDTTFAFKMPIGVGTGPDSGTLLAVGNTGGEEQHELLQDEGAQAPDHQHTFGRMLDDSGSGGDDVFLLTGTATTTGNARQIAGDVQTATTADLSTCDGEYLVSAGVLGASTDGVDKHNNMPPYVAVYFIKRSARQFFTVS